MKVKPLCIEDFAPCHTCGSVQCAICQRRVKEILVELEKRKCNEYHQNGVVVKWIALSDVKQLLGVLLK